MFKEAIHKMPRQFAPQSLYNMMGKSLGGSLVRLFGGRCRKRGASKDSIFPKCATATVVVGWLCSDAHTIFASFILLCENCLILAFISAKFSLRASV